ncbi:MAG: hypothetical protein RLZZ366_789 [Pseudomonadota bacterium]|jgi:carnitine-CoA ligase
MTTIPDLLRRSAVQWPDAEAIVFDATNERLSFAELDKQSDAIARALSAAGIVTGDRVLVCSGNVLLFPLAWLAILKAGAVMVPVNPRYRLDDAAHLLALVEPRAAFCDAERLEFMRTLAASSQGLDLIVTDHADPPRGVQSLRNFAQSCATTAPVKRDISASTLANIQFTSGTSGLPKGCMLSHGYWLALANTVRGTVVALAPGETMLTAQPFSYLDPQWALVLTILSGARLVVLDKFSPSNLWEKIVQHDAHFFYCLAAMPLMMLGTLPTAAEKRHNLRAIMCSAIPSNRHAELEARFGVPWLEAYGSTETGSDLGISWEDHDSMVGIATIGRPLPNREARIVDEAFRTLGPEEDGELLVRGPYMMLGYWRNPEATSEAFCDDWYRTGDLARFDVAGFYHLVGRRKDMIRRGGENIAAAELEAVLNQHPGVLLSACIAVPDPVRNEEVLAYIVPEEPTNPGALIEFLETRLAAFKVPRYWRFVETLPMTPSERVAKPLLSRSLEDAFDRTIGSVSKVVGPP